MGFSVKNNLLPYCHEKKCEKCGKNKLSNGPPPPPPISNSCFPMCSILGPSCFALIRRTLPEKTAMTQ